MKIPRVMMSVMAASGLLLSGCGAWEEIVVDTAQTAAQQAVETVVEETITLIVTEAIDGLLGEALPSGGE